MSETTTGSAATLSEDDYRALEATFLQTARGRSFLAETARRQRAADADLVLAAIARLGDKVIDPETSRRVDRVKEVLAEIGTAILRDSREAAAIPVPGRDAETPAPGLRGLRAAVADARSAISAILDAAEHVQEVAWTLRERGQDAAACDLLDQRATDIYAACALKDAALTRADILIRSVDLMDGRFAELQDSWGIATAAVSEGDVAAAEPTQTGDDEVLNHRRRQMAVLAEIDGLDLLTKLKLFT